MSVLIWAGVGVNNKMDIKLHIYGWILIKQVLIVLPRWLLEASEQLTPRSVPVIVPDAVRISAENRDRNRNKPYCPIGAVRMGSGRLQHAMNDINSQAL